MAQKIVTVYTDDLTGEESQEAATHTFTLNGVSYEIDLGPDSYEQMLEAFSPFIRAGRKTGRVRSRVANRSTKGTGEETAEIRAWAKKNGFKVNDRGRVPVDIKEAYEKAH
ncbi:Lsr2 family protein [Streptomyces kronopolitis]|uniref:histone-like nucleoid-structuring protein Lsr2 n=1 Tax=Streptomyces kronopolitis TaxID=1612435 RepID=UPI0036A2DD69